MISAGCERYNRWVWEAQPLHQCGEDKEVGLGLQEEEQYSISLFIRGGAVETVHSFKYIWEHISRDMTWNSSTCSIIRNAYQ